MATLAVRNDKQSTRRTFALRVRGDSMTDEYLRDGDIVVVAAQETAENGQTVLALIDGNCATIKKFYQEPDGLIRLQAADPQSRPFRIKPERFQIQGIVKGVIRKYEN